MHSHPGSDPSPDGTTSSPRVSPPCPGVSWSVPGYAQRRSVLPKLQVPHPTANHGLLPLSHTSTSGSSPHGCSSPGSVVSSSHSSTWMSLAVRSCTDAPACVIEHYLFGRMPSDRRRQQHPREPRRGGVAASRPTPLPRVALLCYQPRPHVHVLFVSFVMRCDAFSARCSCVRVTPNSNTTKTTNFL